MQTQVWDCGDCDGTGYRLSNLFDRSENLRLGRCFMCAGTGVRQTSHCHIIPDETFIPEYLRVSILLQRQAS